MKTKPTWPGMGQRTGAIPGRACLGVLGRGGMGVVYKARQAGLDRVVALKMVLGGAYAAADQLARFRREGAAIARLVHPHIVQIYEVGDQAGQPFYAMEYVPGGNLASKLAGTPQSPRAAAELVETLARTIQAAHEQGIVHRDLKPANILLAGGPDTPLGQCTPKISDFGLAKVAAAAPRAQEEEPAAHGGPSLGTPSGAIMGSPSYMAPEQAQAKSDVVGPAADIYALGAILYELLTGRPPFKAETSLETVLQVIHEEPVSPRRLQPKLPRDLETVCLKCLAKEPRKRYTTAADLADDLRRFGRGEAIQARPVDAVERLWKWAKRRPAVAGLLAALVLVVSAGLVGMTALWLRAAAARDDVEQRRLAEERERERADANLRLARNAVDQTVSKLRADPRLKEADFHQLRHDLFAYLVPFYEEIVKQQRSDPELEVERGRAFYSLAQLRLEMGDREGALADCEQTRAIFTQLARPSPAVPAYSQELAKSLNLLGKLSWETSRPKEAERHLREAIAIWTRLLADFPSVLAYRNGLAGSVNNLAILLRDTGRDPEAEALFRETIAARKQLIVDSPSMGTHRYLLARFLNDLGVLLGRNGRFEEEETAYREAIAQYKHLADDPTVPDYLPRLAESINNLAATVAHGPRVLEPERAQEAENLYQEAISIQEKVVAKFPMVVEYRRELAQSLNNMGILLLQGNRRLSDAEKYFGAALAHRKELADRSPTVPDYQSQLAGTLVNLARIKKARREFREARELLDQALVHQQIALRVNPRHAAYREKFRDNLRILAGVLADLGDHVVSADTAGQLADFAFEPAADTYNAACAVARCIALATKDEQLPMAQRAELAGAYTERALALLRRAVEKGYKNAAHMKQDGDLEALRSNSQFQTLIRELEEKMPTS